jgi:hypothetical protein
MSTDGMATMGEMVRAKFTALKLVIGLGKVIPYGVQHIVRSVDWLSVGRRSRCAVVSGAMHRE